MHTVICRTKTVLVVEMDPVWRLSGVLMAVRRAGRLAPRGNGTAPRVAGREMDVFRRRGAGVNHVAAAVPERKAGTDHVRPTEEEGIAVAQTGPHSSHRSGCAKPRCGSATASALSSEGYVPVSTQPAVRDDRCSRETGRLLPEAHDAGGCHRTLADGTRWEAAKTRRLVFRS